MTSRERIFDSIRNALGSRSRDLDSPPELHREFQPPNTPRSDLVASFSAEVRRLGGTVAITLDEAACASAIALYLRKQGIGSVAIQGAPFAQAIGSRLNEFELIQTCQGSVEDVERAGCGLVEAPALLADTGSAIVVSTQHLDRLLPYLPRTCVIVSEVSRLHPSLTTHALVDIDKAVRAGVRGEAVIITGPSRTADIEKQLVLGAHGPANLAIFLIQGANG
jgi:L-lactate dehydrogenase complex protein LldG